jgi:fermentation-respiration switch protein FrsA (DUF1100 family)
MARRHSLGAAVVVAVVAVALLVFLVLRDDGPSSPAHGAIRQPAPSAPPEASGPPEETPAGSEPAPDQTGAPYAVDSAEISFTHPGDDRVVDAVAWYPRTARHVPLVVFAHGFATTPETYGDFLAELASAGYVVVAPRSYPTRIALRPARAADARTVGTAGPPLITTVALRTDEEPATAEPDEPAPEGAGSGGGGGSGVAFDFDDQRLDVVATIDVVLGPDPPDELRGRVALDTRVALMGHSDGGVTAAALAFNSIVGDPRVGAAVIMSGDYGYFAGDWFDPGAPALLAIHGDADGVNPISSSYNLYDADGGGAKYLVVVHGAGHIDFLLSDPPSSQVVTVVDDFLGGALGHAPDANDRMARDAGNDTIELVASEP